MGKEQLLELYTSTFGTKDDDGNDIVYEYQGETYICLGREYNISRMSKEELSHLAELIRNW